jgi:hypothetical protein
MKTLRCVGLDVHKDSIAIAVAEPEGGEPSLIGTIPNDTRLLLHIGGVHEIEAGSLADRMASELLGVRAARDLSLANTAGHALERTTAGGRSRADTRTTQRWPKHTPSLQECITRSSNCWVIGQICAQFSSACIRGGLAASLPAHVSISRNGSVYSGAVRR